MLTRPALPMHAHERDLPAAVDAIVGQCVQRSRDARFGSLGELADALRAALAAAG